MSALRARLCLDGEDLCRAHSWACTAKHCRMVRESGGAQHADGSSSHPQDASARLMLCFTQQMRGSVYPSQQPMAASCTGKSRIQHLVTLLQADHHARCACLIPTPSESAQSDSTDPVLL